MAVEPTTVLSDHGSDAMVGLLWCDPVHSFKHTQVNHGGDAMVTAAWGGTSDGSTMMVFAWWPCPGSDAWAVKPFPFPNAHESPYFNCFA